MQAMTRVLCPVDFSDQSRHALEQAVLVAAWSGARVAVLNVYNEVFLPVPGLAMPGYSNELVFGDAERQALRTSLERCAAEAGADPARTDVVIEAGQPVPHILATAASTAADLIVMGTHGVSGFEHLVLGSVTEKVLRKAACPVLTVPPRAATVAWPYHSIVCAVDFSESSEAALRAALHFAQEAQARLTLVHVLEWPAADAGPGPATVDMPAAGAGFNLDAYRRVLAADAEARLQALVPEDARNWCAPSSRVVHGKAYAEILNVARQERAGLLVLGVRGRNALDMMLFGSTANQVVRHASCPVLTVRH